MLASEQRFCVLTITILNRTLWQSWILLGEEIAIQFVVVGNTCDWDHKVAVVGLRVYKELACMKKEQVDLDNKVVFIADSKTPNGVSEVPLTDIAVVAFRKQLELSGPGQWLFPSSHKPTEHQTDFKKTWQRTLRRAGVPYFRLYDLRSTYATRLSAGGVADEWVTQLLRQSDAKVFKKYSQMKLQMKREALARLNREAGESAAPKSSETVRKD